MNEATDTCSLHLQIISTSFGLHWQSKNMHACVQVCMHASNSCSPKICMHASKYACMRPSMQIWVYPTMFRRKKTMGSTLGGCPTMFRWKIFNVQHIGGLSNDVSLEKPSIS